LSAWHDHLPADPQGCGTERWLEVIHSGLERKNTLFIHHFFFYLLFCTLKAFILTVQTERVELYRQAGEDLSNLEETDGLFCSD